MNSKTSTSKTNTQRSKDWEAGVADAISAGKAGPFLGWECLIEGKELCGVIGKIDFKNKSITIRV